MARYLRILWRFWKNSLIRELSFRADFLLNMIIELMWVGMMLVFVKVVFSNTPQVKEWNQHQYFFLMGTHLLMTSLFEAFFFSNCWALSDRVRSGDLDFVLLKPASAQFLLSFERVYYPPLANAPLAIGLCVYAVAKLGGSVSAGKLALYLLLVAAGIAILYALVFMFASVSFWLIRHTGIGQIWFYIVSMAGYPAEIYRKFAGGVLWFGLVFVVPVLLVVNLPANVMVRTFDPLMVAYAVAAAGVLVVLSTLVFRLALRWYRSASS